MARDNSHPELAHLQWRSSQDIMNRNSAACSATTNSIDDELASYASATKSYPGSNALEFWVGAETTFPLLAPLA